MTPIFFWLQVIDREKQDTQLKIFFFAEIGESVLPIIISLRTIYNGVVRGEPCKISRLPKNTLRISGCQSINSSISSFFPAFMRWSYYQTAVWTGIIGFMTYSRNHLESGRLRCSSDV